MIDRARAAALLLALVACGDTEGTAVDCDGEVVVSFIDADGDGYGETSTKLEDCGEPADGRVLDSGDCDDGDLTVYPGAVEACDGVDQDCNGTVDDGLPTSTFYPDLDGDFEGDPAGALDACYEPEGYVLDDSDCDDDDRAVWSGADEVCDAVDNDCDGAIDEEDPDLLPETRIDFFDDADEDGFGTNELVARACVAPPFASPVTGDCDDLDDAINPAATEVCGGGDENCDGLVDDLDPAVDASTFTVWYADADADGLGDPLVSVSACVAPVGYTDDDLDCDDTSALITDVVSWVFDGDGDGFGDGAPVVGGCVPPGVDFVVASGRTDCDDADALVYPGAPEVCGDGVDSDCDLLDDLLAYRDADADGFGDEGDAVDACSGVPPGYVLDGGDCDDLDIDVNPDALEACNDIDDDCDGALMVEETSDIDADGVPTCLDSDDADATSGERFCYDFDATSWSYHSNNNVHPVASGTSELVLSNDNEASVGAAVMLQEGWTPPYTVSLDFYVFDDDGSAVNLFNSADGLAVMVARDPNAYGLPPVGGARGVIVDGTGYAVHLQTYSFRDIHLSDGAGLQLASVAEPLVYTHGVWRSLEVTVRSGGIEVQFEGAPALNWAGPVSMAHDGVGISAATGGSDSEHRVRNVCVTERF